MLSPLRLSSFRLWRWRRWVEMPRAAYVILLRVDWAVYRVARFFSLSVLAFSVFFVTIKGWVAGARWGRGPDLLILPYMILFVLIY